MLERLTEIGSLQQSYFLFLIIQPPLQLPIGDWFDDILCAWILLFVKTRVILSMLF